VTFGRGLKTLSILTPVLLIGAFALAFYYAPMDADQGIRQKIFYLHVPMAIVTLCGFVAGGIFGIKHLRNGDRASDLRSYVAIHMALIFAVGVLITGAFWAKSAWGVWWLWEEPTLTSFLIIFLLYACYQPLRFSIEDPEKQGRYAAVFAVVGGAFVPLNFIAVRLAEPLIHPRTLSNTENLPGPVALAFLACLIAMGVLFTTLCKYELTSKATSMRLKSLRRRLAEDDELTTTGRSAAPQTL
jgi:heme exporter protein C